MNIDETFAKYHTAMYDTCGVECVERTRKQQTVWARNIVAVEMMSEGFPVGQVARRLGLHWATMAHCRQSMRNMLKHPRQYENEMEMYRKFKQAIR